jgi:hypothetical protein
MILVTCRSDVHPVRSRRCRPRPRRPAVRQRDAVPRPGPRPPVNSLTPVPAPRPDRPFTAGSFCSRTAASHRGPHGPHLPERIPMRLANLDGQAGLIPVLAPLHYGPNLAIRNGNRDYGALAVIVSSSDPGHPAHVRIAIEVVSPRAGAGHFVQFTPGPRADLHRPGTGQGKLPGGLPHRSLQPHHRPAAVRDRTIRLPRPDRRPDRRRRGDAQPGIQARRPRHEHAP